MRTEEHSEENTAKTPQPYYHPDDQYYFLSVADTYINLGEIQAASAPQSSDTQGSTAPVSAPGSSPASIPPSAPSSGPAPALDPTQGPGSTPQASSLPNSAPPPPAPTAPIFIPPPVPPENAVAALTAATPPKEEAAVPVSVKPVAAPALKLFEDVNLDSDAKSAQNGVKSKKSKGSVSDARKNKRKGSSEDSGEYKKPKQLYFARGCYCFCFFLFLGLLIVWGLVAAVALNYLHIEFFEKLITNFG
ncbi:hypothetical protein L3Y34_001821 [Caenorhabditis briggsae]|uniref:Uncharacterized protein n=1 Tax=Caenorhabditis briggsae TaxID=6238 RepID=A0AAE9IQW5_CAEBR|nr:hypothetical protein L3Y34_001821 [Caenorhabditis briggsae]